MYVQINILVNNIRKPENDKLRKIRKKQDLTLNRNKAVTIVDCTHNIFCVVSFSTGVSFCLPQVVLNDC